MKGKHKIKREDCGEEKNSVNSDAEHHMAVHKPTIHEETYNEETMKYLFGKSR